MRKYRSKECARCGRMMEDFESQIGGEFYCHTPPLPSCYTRTLWEKTADLDFIFGKEN